ncbi:MAG TPA: FUSC family protein [Solirubrobacteraceae bacterium]|nr:FUSC family protein [Solirubrobacteraceae bacterium]
MIRPRVKLLGRNGGRGTAGAGPPPEPGSLSTAIREAGHFDRRAVSIAGGLLAAIPVVAVLTIGTVAWSAVAGVTMGAGAMLIGIAWRIRGGRPPLAVLTIDALVMALSTFVGSVTGSHHWLHLGVLCAWALMGGLLVALGNGGAVVGNQAVLAAVVFGRFSQPVDAAAGLAGLVLAGGLAQVLFQSLVRWPTPLRAQRAATAAAYRALAGLATASWETSTLPVATALDQAQDGLASPTLFGDPAIMNLRNLVAEGQRLRVVLSAIHALMRRAPSEGEDSPGGVATRLLATTSTALDLIARTVEGDRDATWTLPATIKELSAQADGLVRGRESSAPLLARRLSALAGQLRATAILATSAGGGSSLRDRRPRRHAHPLREGFVAGLGELRANASLESPAGRHAVRLAVVVLIAELLAQHLPLSRSYWMVVAAGTTLRPEFGATFTRGTERLLGTCVGVGLAGAIAVAVHPTGAATIVLVGLLGWAGYAVFPASFALGFAFITALVVFLLNAVSPDTLATAGARLIDTLIGGSLGLAAYAIWPTWSNVPAWQALADLVAADRAYLAAILDALVRARRAGETEVRTLSRRARLARTNAESTVARSLSEPQTRRIDADQSQGILAAVRRVVQAAHVLRLDVQEDYPRSPLPGLQALARDIDTALASIEASLRTRPDEPPTTPKPGLGGREASGSARDRAGRFPDLRPDYLAFERTVPPEYAGDPEGLLGELDEIVDAVNSMAERLELTSGPPAREELGAPA